MTYPKDKMVEAMIEHANGHIAKHKANVECITIKLKCSKSTFN